MNISNKEYLLPDIERKKEEKLKKLSTIRIHMRNLRIFKNNYVLK